MAGLQRSAVSFRRQGSSGLVWDDKLIAELNQKEGEAAGGGGASDTINNSRSQQEMAQAGGEVKEDATRASPRTVGSIERSRSNGGGARGYRTGKVSPAIEPPSPKVSACGFCNAFGKPQGKSRRQPPKHAGKRTM